MATLDNPFRPLEDSDPEKFQEHAEAGRTVYYQNCFWCHGDLRRPTMRLLLLLLAGPMLVGPMLAGPVLAQDTDNGKEIYNKWCVHCHAEDGSGEGVAAQGLHARSYPRSGRRAGHRAGCFQDHHRVGGGRDRDGLEQMKEMITGYNANLEPKPPRAEVEATMEKQKAESAVARIKAVAAKEVAAKASVEAAPAPAVCPRAAEAAKAEAEAAKAEAPCVSTGGGAGQG